MKCEPMSDIEIMTIQTQSLHIEDDDDIIEDGDASATAIGSDDWNVPEVVYSDDGGDSGGGHDEASGGDGGDFEASSSGANGGDVGDGEDVSSELDFAQDGCGNDEGDDCSMDLLEIRKNNTLENVIS